jgi:hypothetical protein
LVVLAQSTEKNLEKAGVKTIDIHSWGGYGNIVITYTYANKLWLNSGYDLDDERRVQLQNRARFNYG